MFSAHFSAFTNEIISPEVEQPRTEEPAQARGLSHTGSSSSAVLATSQAQTMSRGT